MTEKASGTNRKHILSQAPSWFCRAVDANLEARGDEPLNIKGRAANDHRFSAKQRAYNKIKEAEQAKPKDAVERVRSQAKRLAASKKRSKR
jgi:hypothetical protein